MASTKRTTTTTTGSFMTCMKGFVGTFIAPAIFVLLLLVSTSHGSPVPTTTTPPTTTTETLSPLMQLLREPCSAGSQTTANRSTILSNLKIAMEDVRASATNWKNLMKAEPNPRLNSGEVDFLETSTHIHMANFPHDVSDITTGTNDSTIVKAAYLAVSKMYIFVNKSRDNARSPCDTRADAIAIWIQMDTLKDQLKLGLCQADKYLTVSALPMEDEQIPGEDILAATQPNMMAMRDNNCSNMAAVSRVQADYVIARDIVTVMGSMADKFQEMYNNAIATNSSN